MSLTQKLLTTDLENVFKKDVGYYIEWREEWKNREEGTTKPVLYGEWFQPRSELNSTQPPQRTIL